MHFYVIRLRSSKTLTIFITTADLGKFCTAALQVIGSKIKNIDNIATSTLKYIYSIKRGQTSSIKKNMI